MVGGKLLGKTHSLVHKAVGWSPRWFIGHVNVHHLEVFIRENLSFDLQISLKKSSWTFICTNLILKFFKMNKISTPTFKKKKQISPFTIYFFLLVWIFLFAIWTIKRVIFFTLVH
jgi:hypothetical protein